MNIKIVRANIDDAPEILELQKLAYQKEAILYDDWTIPLIFMEKIREELPPLLSPDR